MSNRIETKVVIGKLCASDYLNRRMFHQAVTDWEEQANQEWELYWGKEEVYEPKSEYEYNSGFPVVTLKKMDSSARGKGSK